MSLPDDYLGFAVDARGAVFTVHGPDPGHPALLCPSFEEDLAPHEREALRRDESPALYHWNDLIFLGRNGPRVVYARGKDFIPFDALEYVEQVRSRLADRSLGPVTLQMQPNQVCNDACTFCCTEEYRALPIYKGARFAKQEWLDLVDRHADGGGRVVEIIGGGEPTLHPHFVDVLERIAAKGMRAYLFTNGTQFGKLNGELNHRLLEAIANGCVLLNVSLDGYENRQRVHRKIPLAKTMATYRAMEHIHSIRDRRKMAFYNSFIVTGGSDRESNIEDLYASVERQAGWVDSIHIQNDFVSLSHLSLDVERTRETMQRTIDDFFRKTYLYFNYPLITRFGLRLPYGLSLHNVSSDEFSRCLRALVAPTVECGSFKVWPCGKYSGEAKPEDRMTFDSIPDQMAMMRGSSDMKNGMRCEPCIHSSYNRSLEEIARHIEREPEGELFHYYERGHVERTMCWPGDVDQPKAVTESV